MARSPSRDTDPGSGGAGVGGSPEEQEAKRGLGDEAAQLWGRQRGGGQAATTAGVKAQAGEAPPHSRGTEQECWELRRCGAQE